MRMTGNKNSARSSVPRDAGNWRKGHQQSPPWAVGDLAAWWQSFKSAYPGACRNSLGQ